jgi:hypothetical protein
MFSHIFTDYIGFQKLRGLERGQLWMAMDPQNHRMRSVIPLQLYHHALQKLRGKERGQLWMDPQNHRMRSFIPLQLYHHSAIAEHHDNQFTRLGSFPRMLRHFLWGKWTKYVCFVAHYILRVKKLIVAIMVR